MDTLKDFGIEEYAKRTHRLHPMLEVFIRNLFANLDLGSDTLIIHPCVELGVLQYQGKLAVLMDHPTFKQKNLGIERRRPTEFLELKEEEAFELISKIPQNLRLKIHFNLEQFIQALKIIKIYVLPWKCLPSGRATNAKFTVNGRPIAIKGITPTPCFMFLNFMIWGRGNLNAEGMHCGNCFDLSTKEGMSLFLHEVFHIYQFYRNPFQMLKWYFQAIRDSLRYAGILFSHKHIPFEIEAIVFEHELNRRFSDEKTRNTLKIFEKYR
jgi:hypothetical protein